MMKSNKQIIDDLNKNNHYMAAILAEIATENNQFLDIDETDCFQPVCGAINNDVIDAMELGIHPEDRW